MGSSRHHSMTSHLATRLVVLALLASACLVSALPYEQGNKSGGNQQCATQADRFGKHYAGELAQLCQDCVASTGEPGPCEQCLVQSYDATELSLPQQVLIAEKCLETSRTPYGYQQAGAVQQCIQASRSFQEYAVSAFIGCVYCVVDDDVFSKGQCQQCLAASHGDWTLASSCLQNLAPSKPESDDCADGDDDEEEDDSAESPEYWYELLEGSYGEGIQEVDVSPILPPSPSQVIAKYFGVGTQNYTCTSNLTVQSNGAVAKLYSIPDGKLVGTHFFTADGPVWQTTKGSAAATRLAQVASANPASAADLLLQVTEASGNLEYATYINRAQTAGGRAPAGCKTPGSTAAVPYTAYYIFYAAEISNEMRIPLQV